MIIRRVVPLEEESLRSVIESLEFSSAHTWWTIHRNARRRSLYLSTCCTIGRHRKSANFARYCLFAGEFNLSYSPTFPLAIR